MKSKILTFIIGILVGAIITTLGFLIYKNVNHKNMDRKMHEMSQGMENRGDKPSIPGEINGKDSNSQSDKKEKTTTDNSNENKEKQKENKNKAEDLNINKQNETKKEDTHSNGNA